jgi:hypothetical protein
LNEIVDLIASAIIGAVLGWIVTVLISRPKMTLSKADPVDMRMVGADFNEVARSLRVNVSNEHRWWTLLAPAVACRAQISFYTPPTGHDTFGRRSMVGRWANTPQPQPIVVPAGGGQFLQVVDVDKYTRESRLDIYPGEPGEPLDIAVRFDGDTDCYGWTNDSHFAPRIRNPDWRLVTGVYLVKVTVTGSGTPHVGCFRIHNDGPTRDTFRLEEATADERRLCGRRPI